MRAYICEIENCAYRQVELDIAMFKVEMILKVYEEKFLKIKK